MAGTVLNLTPGQDTIYIAGRSIADCRKAGIASALGVGTGALVHVVAAAVGLSAVLASSALAFTVIKWLGAIYLVYLGVRLIVSRGAINSQTISASDENGGNNSYRAYRRGILTDLLNPKVAIFFLAFLPQFVDISSNHRGLAFLVLGGTFVFTGTIWCLIIAVLSARASEGIRRSIYGGNLVRRIAGIVFVGLGFKLALEQGG